MMTKESEKLREERDALSAQAHELKEQARALTAKINEIEIAALKESGAKYPGGGGASEPPKGEAVAVEPAQAQVRGR